MADAFAERLKAARAHLGLTVAAITAKTELKDRKTWERYEKGETRPNSDILAMLKDSGIDANWLLTGEGDMLAADGRRIPGVVPVVGLAECGLKGWYQESPTGLFASAPPAVAADPGGLAVIATGDSMRPAGIRPGDMVFCRPVETPDEGDSVLVDLADGSMALKRWGGAAGGWVALQGWLVADAGGVQMPYTDQRRADQIRRVLRVALVQPSGASSLLPGGVEITPDDRLYEVAIRAALRWFAAAELDVAPDGMAAMVSRAVCMLRASGGASKTDDEVAAEMGHILSVAHQMARSGGWAPKAG